MDDSFKRIKSIGSFLLELGLYAIFISAYSVLVLHFLEGPIKHVYDTDKTLYAILALALIGAQGILLEIVTSTLMGVFRRRLR